MTPTDFAKGRTSLILNVHIPIKKYCVYVLKYVVASECKGLLKETEYCGTPNSVVTK